MSNDGIPQQHRDIVDAALRPYGFANGKYGDLPYTLNDRLLCYADEYARYGIDIDGRPIAQVGLIDDGDGWQCKVDLRVGEWFKAGIPSTDIPLGIVGIDPARAGDASASMLISMQAGTIIQAGQMIYFDESTHQVKIGGKIVV